MDVGKPALGASSATTGMSVRLSLFIFLSLLYFNTILYYITPVKTHNNNWVCFLFTLYVLFLGKSIDPECLNIEPLFFMFIQFVSLIFTFNAFENVWHK